MLPDVLNRMGAGVYSSFLLHVKRASVTKVAAENLSVKPEQGRVIITKMPIRNGELMGFR